MSLAWLETSAPSLRDEFRAWLRNDQFYDEESIQTLLDKEWDGAIPLELLGDDIKTDIGNFLYYMAKFTVEKIYGDGLCYPELWITIVPDPSYEDRSYVYVLEMNNKRVLARSCGCKTWHHNPEVIDEDLRNLIEQLEKSKIEACPVCGKIPKAEYICPEHGQMG